MNISKISWHLIILNNQCYGKEKKWNLKLSHKNVKTDGENANSWCQYESEETWENDVYLYFIERPRDIQKKNIEKRRD